MTEEEIFLKQLILIHSAPVPDWFMPSVNKKNINYSLYDNIEDYFLDFYKNHQHKHVIVKYYIPLTKGFLKVEDIEEEDKCLMLKIMEKFEESKKNIETYKQELKIYQEAQIERILKWKQFYLISVMGKLPEFSFLPKMPVEQTRLNWEG